MIEAGRHAEERILDLSTVRFRKSASLISPDIRETLRDVSSAADWTGPHGPLASTLPLECVLALSKGAVGNERHMLHECLLMQSF